MKYYLIYTDGPNFGKITGFSKFVAMPIDENKLSDIVKFTNTFKNYQELLDFLYYNGLIPSMNYKLNIAYINGKNGILHILPFGISFKNEAKYFDIKHLNNYLVNHMGDENFMNAFLDRYYSYLRNTPNVGTFIKNIKRNYEYFLTSHLMPLDSRLDMEDFLTNYTIKKSNNTTKREFAKLRDVAMFVIDYQRRKEKKNNRGNNEELIRQIKHLKELLKDEYLSKEVSESYEAKISNLEDLINPERRRRL